LLVVALAACEKPKVEPAKVSPSIVPQLPGHVTALRQAEIASAVIPPGANPQCADGAVVVTWDLDYWNYAMGAGLSCLGQCVWGDTEELPGKALPVPPGTVQGTNKVTAGACDYSDPTQVFDLPEFWCNSGDVNIATLPGGKLLQLGLCQRLRSPVKPPCAQQIKLRDVLVFRGSDDCGHTWSVLSWLDAKDVLLKGPAGWPYSATNLDRDEMHFDSWHDLVHVSVAAFTRNPLPIGGEWIASGGVLLESSNYGANWKVLSNEMSTGVPFVMTSSPTGWLYIFNCDPEWRGPGPDDWVSVPTIRWLDIRPAAAKKIETATLWPYKKTPSGFLCTSVSPIAGGIGYNLPQYGISHQAAVRDADWLHVAYPHVSGVYPGHPVQEGRVVTFRVLRDTADPSDPEAPAVSVLDMRKLAPGNPYDSVGFLTFMQPDRLGGVHDNDPAIRTSLLTWLETYTVVKPTSLETYVRQRVQVVSNAISWSPPYDLPSDLSFEGGKVQAWRPNFDWLGDYHNNGFAYRDAATGDLRFVVTWPQSDPLIAPINEEVHANIVSVHPAGTP
jgi:hypothetical protein